MADARGVQFSTAAGALAAVVVITSVLCQPAHWLCEPVGNDPAHRAIRDSAIWPVFIWCGCWPLAFARTGDMKAGRYHRRGMQFTWALGCLLLLLHIAVAFHLGHGWSHAAAWKHTQQVGGFGDGIYVNYALALVWLADAAWLCAAPGSYCARPRWLSWTVHGFIAFVIFNAAVVFGGAQSRGMFAFGFIPVATLLILGWWLGRTPQREPPSAE